MRIMEPQQYTHSHASRIIFLLLDFFKLSGLLGDIVHDIFTSLTFVRGRLNVPNKVGIVLLLDIIRLYVHIVRTDISCYSDNT